MTWHMVSIDRQGAHTQPSPEEKKMLPLGVQQKIDSCPSCALPHSHAFALPAGILRDGRGLGPSGLGQPDASRGALAAMQAAAAAFVAGAPGSTEDCGGVQAAMRELTAQAEVRPEHSTEHSSESDSQSWLCILLLLHIFILRLSVSMDHNGVAVRVCWVWVWAVGRGLGRLSHTSLGPVRLPPPSAC